jgi:quinol---cytochrome c reductase iron-sulfur subunit, bacillus type
MSAEPGLPEPNQESVVERAKKVARDGEEGVSRRTFLFKVSIAVNAIIGVAIATPVIGYLLGVIRRKGGYDSWIVLGPAGDYHEGQTVLATYRNPFMNPWDGDTAKVACYVRCEAPNQFTVFAVNCAHLGCPVRWFPQSELFMCPCHGGVYYSNGERAAGPPERGLFTYDYRVVGGKLMINAGQMPTLANEAKLVKGILPCPGTSKPTIG